MMRRLRSWFGLVPLLPELLFPTIPVPAARWAALVPVAGTLAACWGAGFIRYGKTPVAIFVATVLVTLGISLLVGIRVAARAIAHHTAANDSKDPKKTGELDPSVLILFLPGLGFFAGAGAGVMFVMTAGGIGSPTAPALNFPAQMGIWLWLAHELYYCHWAYVRHFRALRAEHTTPNTT